MVIDVAARQRLMEEKRNKMLTSSIKDAVSQAIPKVQPQEEDTQVMKLVVKNQNDPKLVNMTEKLGQAIVLIYKAIKNIHVTFPKIYKVTGSVDVDSLPPVKVENLNVLGVYFESLERRISQIATAISMTPATKIEIPKFEIPKGSSFDDSRLLGALQDLKKTYSKTSDSEDITDALFKVQQAVMMLVNRPNMTTPPVTNINVNPLHGVVKSTSTTVGTTLTRIPGYGQLSMRRSIILFNNSANTIYYGGSDVTTSNGTPVLSQSYSPSIDAGYDMVLYAIAGTSGNDVRSIEISNTTVQVDGSLT